MASERLSSKKGRGVPECTHLKKMMAVELTGWGRAAPPCRLVEVILTTICCLYRQFHIPALQLHFLVLGLLHVEPGEPGPAIYSMHTHVC